MPSRRRRNTRLSPNSPAFPSDFTTEICATAKAEPVQLVMHATEKGSKTVIVHRFGGVPLMLKEQILLHLPIVTVFYGHMLWDGCETHLPAFQCQPSSRRDRRMPS